MNANKQDAGALPEFAADNSRESKMVVIERDGDGVPSIWCDPEIADIVRAMNSAGIRTVASCSGHGLRPGRISLADGREMILLDDLESANRLFSKSADGVPEPSDAIKEFCTVLPLQRAEDLMTYVRAYGRECYEAGEQCRAASDRAEMAVDLPKIRRWVGPRPMIYMNSFDGQPPCLTLNNARWVIHDLMDEVERLRALSRGVPEGMVLVPLVPTDEMTVAFCEAWFAKKRPIDDPEIGDAWAAAIAAQRKEGD